MSAVVLQDAVTMSARSLRRTARELDTLLLSVLLPVMLMLLFVGVFGGAIAADGRYVDYVVPGVLLLCTGYGAAQTAVAVAADLSDGLVRRLRTMPVSAFSVLTGHVVSGVVRNAVSTVAVVGVALALGFRPVAGPVEWLAVAGLLLAFVLAVSWVSVCVGLLAGGVEAAGGFTFFVLFLPYLSSAFVPVHTLPAFLQGVATHQPSTPIIETLRGLLLGTGEGAPAVALLWCGGLVAVGVPVAALLFRRAR